jgi:hypothetical protein
MWWLDKVGYKVYLRSFADGDGDGVGDLRGLGERLEYLAWLGVGIVWVTPFYPSPMRDHGYDVADYTGVDPLFGSLDDFDQVLAGAHDLARQPRGAPARAPQRCRPGGVFSAAQAHQRHRSAGRARGLPTLAQAGRALRGDAARGGVPARP